ASSVATLVFHAIAETWAGGTPGKLICGLRVIGQDGKRIGFLRGLGRNLAYFIDALFFALPAYSAMDASGPRNLRYGDKWARTMVVSAADANLRVPRSLAMVFVTLMVATAANMSVNALALLASWS
ncbi:MAG TPA: RDD family protein, partial [Myxococcota bacterium]